VLEPQCPAHFEAQTLADGNQGTVTNHRTNARKRCVAMWRQIVNAAFEATTGLWSSLKEAKVARLCARWLTQLPKHQHDQDTTPAITHREYERFVMHLPAVSIEPETTYPIEKYGPHKPHELMPGIEHLRCAARDVKRKGQHRGVFARHPG
jgi:hypothetical protein